MEKTMPETYRYTCIFEPAAEGGYVVTCPGLPGLVTEGDTLEEAREMARDAIRGYLESLLADGVPAPKNPEPLPDPLKETV
ncbi:MAG: type II toxin-antitoxin system HicB family antitoxin [Gemmatimonadetes bacterium]|nr:type II toxin-antitoxin system HicB family antitoxin [Gemmatimonadota bacterium]